MTGPAHDRGQLGAFAIGALDPNEARMVHDHLSGCPDCQAEVNELMMIRRALDQVPPEAFLDGPPENGDLLLRRTLRRVADETGPSPARRTGLYLAAAAAVVVALGGGILLGRQTAPEGSQVAGPMFTVATVPSNARIAEATDPVTGASLNVALEPKKGWVWVHATAKGLPEGEPCELYVISTDGRRELAGSWLVTAEGAKISRLEGMALIAPDNVKEIEVQTRDGQEIVTVPIQS